MPRLTRVEGHAWVIVSCRPTYTCFLSYFARSARVSGRLGICASLLISTSETEAVDGGCDQYSMSGGKLEVSVLCRRFQT